MLSLLLCIATFNGTPADFPQDDWRLLATKAQEAEAAGNLAEAKKLLDAAIKVEPKRADLYSIRGGVHFKLGSVEESLADFNQQILLKPQDKAAHWRRGLSLYYAGKYAEGAAQFVSSDRAEPEDVENAVWHLLCNARAKGLDAARKEMLSVKNDSRIPMMEVYALFAGNSTIDKVLAAAETSQAMSEKEKQAHRFYAHLYCGLFAEMIKQPEKARELITKAVQKYPVNHYMQNVGEVHLKLRAK
ncbi:MAG TPA: tetratricopeptide repeat protein [Gemmatales bacterium]|nr:tetratricopeptide repeat protein [Gemmatales bacterium]